MDYDWHMPNNGENGGHYNCQGVTENVVIATLTPVKGKTNLKWSQDLKAKYKTEKYFKECMKSTKYLFYPKVNLIS